MARFSVLLLLVLLVSSMAAVSAAANARIDVPTYAKPGSVHVKVTLSEPVEQGQVRLKKPNLPNGQVIQTIPSTRLTVEFDYTIPPTFTPGEAVWSVMYTNQDTFEFIEVGKTSMFVDFNGPTVSWNSPTEGQSVQGNAVLSVTSKDDWSGVKKVEFFDGANKIGDANKSGVDTYAMTWDASRAANGDHLLKIVATDGAGNSTESIRVITIPAPAPVTPPEPEPEPEPDENQAVPDQNQSQAASTSNNASFPPEWIVAIILFVSAAAGGAVYVAKGGTVGFGKKNPTIVQDLDLNVYKLVPEKKASRAPSIKWPGKQPPKENKLLGEGKLKPYR